MISKYKVVTLCGSTKFKEVFQEVQKLLELKGCIVISSGVYSHSGDEITQEEKKMLGDMHRCKIDMADEVFVVNKYGYIGPATRGEIEYAVSKGIPVKYLEP